MKISKISRQIFKTESTQPVALLRLTTILAKLGALALLLRHGPLVVILTGFALRLYNLGGESLWYDELLQLDIVQQPLAAILPALPRHAAVPLDYIITHFWVLLGRQDGWVRLPAVMLGTLALPLAFQLGRRLLGPSAGLLFMSLVMLSPFHVHYSQEARPYALLILGVILAGYGFWQLRLSGRWRYAVPLQIGVLFFSLSHFFGVVIFGPWLLFGAIDFLFGRRQQALKAIAGLIAAALVTLAILLAMGWGPTFIKVTSLFSETLIEPQRFMAEAEVKPNQGSGPNLDWNFVRYDILGPLGAGGEETALQLFNGLAGLGLLYLLARKKFELALWLLLWLCLPIITVVAFLTHRGEFFASRYILSTLPAYLLLVTLGLLALPRWLKCAQPGWLSLAALVILLFFSLTDLSSALRRYYRFDEKEDWRLVSQFISRNAQPEDAVIAVNAEATMNWYYPPARAEPDYYDELETIKATVAASRRSWVIMSVFTAYMGEREAQIKAWLSEQGAIRLVLDPLIAVYYLGPEASPDQLLEEIQGFVLPVDHALYASLARENRRRPGVAAQYFRLAIEYAPDEATRAQYQAEMETLLR